MSDENLFNKIASLVISLTALILAYLAMDSGYIGVEVFLTVMFGVLAAWGITFAGTSIYKAGKQSKGLFSSEELAVIADIAGKLLTAWAQVEADRNKMELLKQMKPEAKKIERTRKETC